MRRFAVPLCVLGFLLPTSGYAASTDPCTNACQTGASSNIEVPITSAQSNITVAQKHPTPVIYLHNRHRHRHRH